MPGREPTSSGTRRATRLGRSGRRPTADQPRPAGPPAPPRPRPATTASAGQPPARRGAVGAVGPRVTRPGQFVGERVGRRRRAAERISSGHGAGRPADGRGRQPPDRQPDRGRIGRRRPPRRRRRRHPAAAGTASPARRSGPVVAAGLGRDRSDPGGAANPSASSGTASRLTILLVHRRRPATERGRPWPTVARRARPRSRASRRRRGRPPSSPAGRAPRRRPRRSGPTSR